MGGLSVPGRQSASGEQGEPGGTAAPATLPKGSGGLRGQATRGVFWTATEKWSVRLSTFVGFAVLSNLLDPRAFGVVALATTFITILTSVSDAGFSNYLLKTQRITQASTCTAFYTTAGLALVFSGALAALSGPISSALDTPELEPVLPALAFSLLASGFSSVPAVLLRKELRFKELAMRNVAATVLSIVAAIVLALLGAGVWALVAQTVVRNLVALVVLWARSDFRPTFAFDRSEARAMTSYGVQSLAVSLGNQLRSQGEVFFIGALAGPVALGYWTVGGRLVGVVVDVCTSIITSVATPIYSRVQDDHKRLGRALAASTAMGSVVMVPALVFLSLTSNQVVPAVFGNHWAPSAAIASALAIRSLVRNLSQFNGTLLMATGHPSSELVVTVVTLVLQMGSVVLLAHHLVWLALTLAGCQAVGIPIRIVLVRRFFTIPLSTYAQALVVLLAGGLAAGAVVGAQSLLQLPDWGYAAVCVLLGGAVYLGVMLLWGRPTLDVCWASVRSVLPWRRRRRSTRSAAA